MTAGAEKLSEFRVKQRGKVLAVVPGNGLGAQLKVMALASAYEVGDPGSVVVEGLFGDRWEVVL